LDLALLAPRFQVLKTLSEQLGIKIDTHVTIKLPIKPIFPLYITPTICVEAIPIVWAISEVVAARVVDKYLMGYTNLPTKGGEDLPSNSFCSGAPNAKDTDNFLCHGGVCIQLNNPN
jgi:glutamate synthase (NADPH/NADH) small chain